MISVFVSHSVKDCFIAKSFVKHILNLGLGIENKEIRCVSAPSNKIPPGRDWRNSLQKDIKSCKVIFQIITQNFLESKFCQYEVGAAWLSEAYIFPLIVDPISFSDAGALIEVSEIVKINDSSGLDRIKDILCSEEGLTLKCKLVSTTEWNSSKEWFIKDYETWLNSENPISPIDIDLEDKGFRLLGIDDALKLSVKILATVKTMRVVGIGRQYYGEKKDDSNLSNYLNTIEDKLLNKDSSFDCYRLTIMDLKQPFLNHLRNCFVNSKTTNYKNQFSLGIVDDLEMKFTYYVLGTHAVFINIYYKESETKIVDSPSCLISRNKEIVDLFTKHFDRVWEREIKKNAVIHNLEEFEKRIPYDAKIISSQKAINEYVKQLHHNTSRSAFAISEISQLEYRLRGLINYFLKIQYKIDNGKFLNIISNFLQQLQKGDGYETISFFEFWQNIQSESVTEFLDANRKALENEASLFRIYLIDEGRLQDLNYIIGNTQIFKEHLDILKLKNRNWNYSFKIQFVEESQYKTYKDEYRNFAIWQTNTEKVFFNPKWDKTGLYQHPIETQIAFIDKTVNVKVQHTNYAENQAKFDKATIIFRGIKEQIQTIGKLTTQHKEFLKNCKVPKKDWELLF